jgi:hypothetical protein
MALRNAVSTEAKNCPKCGALVKKKTSTFTWIVGGLFGAAVLSSIFSPSKSPTPSANPGTSASPTSPRTPAQALVAPPAPKPPPTPAEAVAEVEALLKRGKIVEAQTKALAAGKSSSEAAVQPITMVEWADGRSHLNSIPKDVPEYAKAQMLLKAMDDRDKRNAEFMAAENAKAKVQGRKEFASRLEENFIEQRMNVDVTALGPQNTTLRIKYVLASKVTANDLNKSGIIEKAQSAGFKVVQFTDGYDSTWTWKLNPPRD